jgi:hypothetical protein
MTSHGLILSALAFLALGACDEPKPRHVPPDPMAVAQPAPASVAAEAPPGLSEGLRKRPEPAGFSLDRVGEALDPLNKQPAVVSAAQPILLQGFGFDPVAKAPAKGVDVVIDGKAYGTTYGAGRPDVSVYFKTPSLTPVGFKTSLPAGLVGVGDHQIVVRVIAADGKAYFDGPPIAFQVAFAEPRRH